MRKPPTWISKQAALAIHERLLAEHGGAPGLLDEGRLDAALASPKNHFADARGDILRIAAAYAHALTQNHPFADGHKRVALTVAGVFMELNGFLSRLRNRVLPARRVPCLQASPMRSSSPTGSARAPRSCAWRIVERLGRRHPGAGSGRRGSKAPAFRTAAQPSRLLISRGVIRRALAVIRLLSGQGARALPFRPAARISGASRGPRRGHVAPFPESRG